MFTLQCSIVISEEEVKRFILAVVGIVAVAALFLAQAQQGKLASLIQAGNRKAALDMIRAGADVNEAQPDATRPIHWAVYRVDYEVLEALIVKNAKANVANELGSTPLAEAVKLGDARMVKMLLAAGSGPEGINADGETALMLAIKDGNLPIVQMLVDAGANVNAVEKVQEQTPLMWAADATQNAPEMVKLLISRQAKVNVRAKFTDWPSQITSEPRAQYHSYGGLTPLLYAARNGCYACVEDLVAAGADVNLPSPESVTPLLIALDYNHNDVAKFLMDHGANPKVWDVYGRTALYIAVDKKEGGTGGGFGAGGGRGGAGAAAGGRGAGAPGAPAAGQAAAAGRGAGGRGAGGAGFGRGNAPAAPRGSGGPAVSNMDIINSLLAAGVDPNAQLSMRRPSGQGGRFSDPLLSTGTTPLFRAVMNTDMEVTRLLLDKGANPNIFAMGTTPFLLAAGVNPYGGRGGGGGAAAPAPNKELLDLLIQHGADVNSQVTGVLSYSARISRSVSNTEGSSALHAAVQSGRADMVRYLLDHGARIDLKDRSDRTPLDVALGVPVKPLPPGAGTANVPNPYAPAEVTPAREQQTNALGRGASPEIRTMLQDAGQRK
jgi:ankyrin repeat protein